ncbi:unnamed protein product [Closterium sp. NIES-64]|nr:unnamed protein product [Closterium sp. NIES-64]
MAGGGEFRWKIWLRSWGGDVFNSGEAVLRVRSSEMTSRETDVPLKVGAYNGTSKIEYGGGLGDCNGGKSIVWIREGILPAVGAEKAVPLPLVHIRRCATRYRAILHVTVREGRRVGGGREGGKGRGGGGGGGGEGEGEERGRGRMTSVNVGMGGGCGGVACCSKAVGTGRCTAMPKTTGQGHLLISSSPPLLISSFPHLHLSSSPHFPISSSPPLIISSSHHLLISSSHPLLIYSSPHFLISTSPHFPISSSPPPPISSSPHLSISSFPVCYWESPSTA